MATEFVETCTKEFYLMDSAPYFFNHVVRIGSPQYCPNENDVRHARRQKVGIEETHFDMGSLFIYVFDVGGQCSERKKWIHCFECVTSIIFCTSLAEYDEVLLENKAQNRMTEYLILFESVFNSRWFLQTSIILLLTKLNAFKAKLHKSPLGDAFPEYTGGADPSKAANYILWKFTNVNRSSLSLYPQYVDVYHFDLALLSVTSKFNRKYRRRKYLAIKETLLRNALKDSGII